MTVLSATRMAVSELNFADLQRQHSTSGFGSELGVDGAAKKLADIGGAVATARKRIANLKVALTASQKPGCRLMPWRLPSPL